MKTINKIKKVIMDNGMNNVEYNFKDFVETIRDYYTYGKNNQLLGTGKTLMDMTKLNQKIAWLFDTEDGYVFDCDIEASLFGLANEYPQYLSFTQTHDLNLVWFHF